MNNYFWNSLISGPGVTIFVLCLYLIQVQTGSDSLWEGVLEDLNQIEKTEMDVFLYTADAKFPANCSIRVKKCFVEEMKVIVYESQLENNNKVHGTMSRIIRIVMEDLEARQNTEISQCQKCETFEEKNYGEFMESFRKNVQRWHREDTEAKRGF
uniref:Interleukin n=1 Tax=Pogona vitticeps TaxID=103695 RepID=A0ABM5GJ83_9SAUR